MSTPRAAIVIPHYRDEARLARCLAALAPQLGPEIELVVVDNGSPGGLTLPEGAPEGLRLVTETQQGAAHARNRGVAETTAEQLFFLDCDCVPDTDWLETALRVCARAPLVGGRVSVFDETPPPRSGAEAFETVFAFDNRRYVEEKNFSVTANLLSRRAVFAAVGPFPANMSEDVEWCRRAVRAGYTLVYEESLRVAHPTRQDWPALRRKWRRLSSELFGLEHSGPLSRLKWGVRGLAMPLTVLVQAPRVLRHPALDRGERRRALGTLLRLRVLRMTWILKQALTGRN